MPLDTDDTSSDDTTTPDVFLDAADRLERTLDAQLTTLRNLEARAGIITRLIAGLLGVLVSVGSLGVTLGSQSRLALPTPSIVAVLTVGIGTIMLIGSMLGAIVTYLSSQPIAGLSHQTAAMLSQPEYDSDLNEHLRRTIGVYAYALRTNTAVLQANAARFRATLMLLLVGIVYLTLGTMLIVIDNGLFVELGLTALVTTTVGGAAWYILTGNYLVNETQHTDTDHVYQ